MAAALVREFTLSGQTLYEPFSGCGSIAFESWVAGCNVIANDLSPYARLLTRAKLFPHGSLELALDDLHRSAKAVRKEARPDLRSVPKWVREFFHPDTLREILIWTSVLRRRDLIGLTMFLSSGVFGLTIVPELSSVAMQGQPIRVITFPSWNTTQLAAVCSEMQASHFTIVHGIPPDPKNAWRRNALRALNRIERFSDQEEFNVSTLDYRETLDLLLNIYNMHRHGAKLVISPTGSKMQSLAVGVICAFLRDVQVAYPTPRLFAAPADYTQGVGHLYRLPLEQFRTPVTAVGQRATSEV